MFKKADDEIKDTRGKSNESNGSRGNNRKEARKDFV